MILSFCGVAHASAEGKNVISKKEKFETFLAENMHRSGGSRYLTVPLVRQETSYYCGPASVQMVLQYFGIYRTQSQLADDMGTTYDDGTGEHMILSGLDDNYPSNSYVKKRTYSTYFGNELRGSIDAGGPVICLLMTGELPHYDGYNTGHYIVATGYMWAQGGSGSGGTNSVTFNDSNNQSRYYGEHTSAWEEMETAIDNHAGYYWVMD